VAKRGSSNVRDNQDRRALLSYALFRWESAAILALTLVLVFLVPDPFRGVLPVWRWWYWLILGGLAETLIVVTTLRDPDVRAGLADERVRERLAATTIANVDYREAAERALRHRAEAGLLLERTRNKAQRERLRPVVEDVTRWAARIVRLVQFLDDHPQPNQVHPRAESTLQDALQGLETTYMRLQLIAAEGLNERRIAQLRAEIADQVRVLQEMMESLT
jgi:hypothetical protein